MHGAVGFAYIHTSGPDILQAKEKAGCKVPAEKSYII